MVDCYQGLLLLLLLVVAAIVLLPGEMRGLLGWGGDTRPLLDPRPLLDAADGKLHHHHVHQQHHAQHQHHAQPPCCPCRQTCCMWSYAQQHPPQCNTPLQLLLRVVDPTLLMQLPVHEGRWVVGRAASGVGWDVYVDGRSCWVVGRERKMGVWLLRRGCPTRRWMGWWC